MKFRNQLGSYLNSLQLFGVGVELGVHTGQFAKQILLKWNGKKLWLIDSWQHLDDYLDSYNASDRIMEQRFNRTIRNLTPWASKFECLRERSENAVIHFNDISLDFVYIDANHSYQHSIKDLHLWYPKVKHGGLFAGHDYFNALADDRLEPIFTKDNIPYLLTSYGVKAAVDEFAHELNIDLTITKEKYPTWYFLKT